MQEAVNALDSAMSNCDAAISDVCEIEGVDL